MSLERLVDTRALSWRPAFRGMTVLKTDTSAGEEKIILNTKDPGTDGVVEHVRDKKVWKLGSSVDWSPLTAELSLQIKLGPCGVVLSAELSQCRVSSKLLECVDSHGQRYHPVTIAYKTLQMLA